MTPIDVFIDRYAKYYTSSPYISKVMLLFALNPNMKEERLNLMQTNCAGVGRSYLISKLITPFSKFNGGLPNTTFGAFIGRQTSAGNFSPGIFEKYNHDKICCTDFQSYTPNTIALLNKISKDVKMDVNYTSHGKVKTKTIVSVLNICFVVNIPNVIDSNTNIIDYIFPDDVRKNMLESIISHVSLFIHDEATSTTYKKIPFKTENEITLENRKHEIYANMFNEYIKTVSHSQIHKFDVNKLWDKINACIEGNVQPTSPRHKFEQLVTILNSISKIQGHSTPTIDDMNITSDIISESSKTYKHVFIDGLKEPSIYVDPSTLISLH